MYTLCSFCDCERGLKLQNVLGCQTNQTVEQHGHKGRTLLIIIFFWMKWYTTAWTFVWHKQRSRKLKLTFNLSSYLFSPFFDFVAVTSAQILIETSYWLPKGRTTVLSIKRWRRTGRREEKRKVGFESTYQFSFDLFLFHVIFPRKTVQSAQSHSHIHNKSSFSRLYLFLSLRLFSECVCLSFALVAELFSFFSWY